MSYNNENEMRPEPTFEDIVEDLVNKLCNNSKTIIAEFVEDGAKSEFEDIPMLVWYNALSSLCALASRLNEIKESERLQEAVVYKTMLMILTNNIDMNHVRRETVINLYKKLAPTVIDILIPGKDEHCRCCIPKNRK